jgi:hypothetical protein
MSLQVQVLKKDKPPNAEGFEAFGATIDRYVVRVDTRTYSVLVGHEPTEGDRRSPSGLRWHISVAGDGSVPRWNHLVAITHHFRPGVVFAVPLPPQSWWINQNVDCLHVWEIHDEHLVDSWRLEPGYSADVPT